jgi:plastocyanin
VGAQAAPPAPNVGNNGFKGQFPNPDSNNPNPIYATQDIGATDIPGVPAKKGAPPFSFDIGWVDNNGFYYLADRTNKGIDIINNVYNGNTYNTTIGGFVGFTGKNDDSGPNGVVTDAQGNTAWAGDGDSTLKVIDVNARKVVASIPTGGTKRADELAYDPNDNLILIANDADDPPFITFISTTSNSVVGQVKYPDATSGIEQSVYSPSTGMFYLAVPQTKQNPGGQIDVIDPKSLKVAKSYAVQNCVPHGLAAGPNNQLLLGCSGDGMKILKQHAQSQIMDATNGNIVATINKVGGSDEVWFLPGLNRYYLAASSMTDDGTADGKPMPVMGVIDAVTNTWIENVPIEVGSHSVAADPLSYQVYVPQRSTGVEWFLSPPPLNATVYITDQGFYPKVVNVGQGSGSNAGILTFINKGTVVHSATELLSSLGQKVTAAGGVSVNGEFNGVGSQGNSFNTGGIGPGQSITVGFQGTDADYSYSSYPDCIAGDRPPTTAFDCKSANVVHVTDYQGDQSLAKSVPGTMVAPPDTDPTQCVEKRNQQTIDQNGAPTGTAILCILDHRIRAKSKGNDQKPLTGNVDVTIDDINGFLPGKVTVTAGTTVTWTNKGQIAHSVYYKPAVWANASSNGRNIVDSGVLYPGQSFSYTFPIPLTSSATIISAVRRDAIEPGMTPNEQGSKTYSSNGKKGTFSLPSIYQGSVKVDCAPTQSVPFGAAQGVGRGLGCASVPPVLSTPSYLGATKA